jgi:hypothetical protein
VDFLVVLGLMAVAAGRGDAHVATLARVLATEPGSRAVTAARALSLSGASTAAPVRAAVLTHRHAGVRVAAASALAHVGSSTRDEDAS